jgi:hypothetical protein
MPDSLLQLIHSLPLDLVVVPESKFARIDRFPAYFSERVTVAFEYH